MKYLKTQKQLNEETENLNISDVSGSVSKEDKFLINGSGLFFFKSRLDDKKKLEIAKWYKNLSDEHREFVDIIRSEAIDETDFFSQGD
ncbi:hypothetical protein [Methanoculleus sp.]|jgi:hypothetical protein|uniref:hypothetical protein n=1 Tax=Methanoculleus sp. TaxID=90427 RepID=UPI0025D83F1A|nr:hypothetical protein [Methanoculleus sp.]MCK9319402.1 hypothetical protein [Methanoculleus sp.]